ncbi:MAG TPA: amidohydrolase family protein [Terriglobales bacterium]|nr:amidohydrolase family protein [Terriglobales bacterium]
MIIGPCTVVTGGATPDVLEDSGVRVVGAHISALGPLHVLASAYPDETLWPARGRVLLPGFINTHVHLARHLARGLGLRGAAEWRRYDRALSPEDVMWSATAALVEGLRHGVTTVCDFHRSGACPDLSLSEIVAAAAQVGVRVATCYGASESDSLVERRSAFEESLGFASEIARRRDGRLRGMVGVRARTLAGVDSMVREALDVAGGSLGVHVDLDLDLTPAERWRSRGGWRTQSLPTLWAHAESAPRGLLGELRERGDALTAMGGGAVAALVREGEVAWGSDAGVNAPPLPDPVHGLACGAPAEAHYQRLFANGARWAGHHFGEGLGEISPGASADLILVDYQAATELSRLTFLDHLGSGMLRAPVSGAMIGGEVVLDNGTLVSVDEREVAARARECARRVWDRLG